MFGLYSAATKQVSKPWIHQIAKDLVDIMPLAQEKNPVAEDLQGKETSPDADSKTDRLHDPRLLQDKRRSEEIYWHERLINENLKKFDGAWEQTLMALEKGREDDLLIPLPWTVGEVDTHAWCFGALCHRSDSPKRAG